VCPHYTGITCPTRSGGIKLGFFNRQETSYRVANISLTFPVTISIAVAVLAVTLNCKEVSEFIEFESYKIRASKPVS
jgi:hypothetical protein